MNDVRNEAHPEHHILLTLERGDASITAADLDDAVGAAREFKIRPIGFERGSLKKGEVYSADLRAVIENLSLPEAE